MKKSQLREMMYAVENARRKMMKPYFVKLGLTVGQGQPRVLYHLYHHEPMTQRELADACYLDAATMSRTLDRLTQAGLLRREAKPGCRRSYHIVLTQEGREKAKEVIEGFRVMDEAICKDLSPKELEHILGVLSQIEENLEQAEKMMRAMGKEKEQSDSGSNE